MPWLAATLVTVTVVRGLAGYAERVTVAKIGQDVVRRLRDRMYGRLLASTNEATIASRGGEVAARLGADVGQVHGLVGGHLASVGGDLITLIGLIGVAFGLDATLALVALAALPPVILWIAWLAGRVRRAHRRVWKAHGEVSARAAELPRTHDLLKAYGAEREAATRFARLGRELEALQLEATRLSAIATPLIQGLGAVAVAAALVLSAPRLASGELAGETFVSFFAAVFFLYRPLQGLGGTVHRVAAGLAAVDRVEEVLDLPMEARDPDDAVDLPPLADAITLSDLRFAYREGEPVLEGLNLRIAAGRSLAIVGPSGSGKSTLISLLLGLLEPDAGEVAIDGVSARRARRESWRRQFAWVTQEPLLLAGTLLDNVALGDEAPDRERAHAALTAAGAAFVDALPGGLDAEIREAGRGLSGGQRQRLCIARALYRDSPVLIFDEATSSLDVPSEREISETLESLMSERTVIVISHRPSTVRRADRVAVLEGGRIVEEGTPAELSARGGAFRALFDEGSRDAPSQASA